MTAFFGLQTLLKTEILKNQLQIASTISQNPTSVLSPAGGAAANVLNGLAANAGGNLSFTTPFSDPPSNGANHNSPKWVQCVLKIRAC